MILDDNPKSGDYRFIKATNVFYVEMHLGAGWGYLADDTRTPIGRYSATLRDGNIIVGAYDGLGRSLNGNMKSLARQYKILPAYCVVIAFDMENVRNFKEQMVDFAEHPTKKKLVRIHEDFYQRHKAESYELDYDCLTYLPFKEMVSFKKEYGNRETRERIAKAERMEKKMIDYRKEALIFKEDAFLDEYKGLIPKLGSEFIAPERLAKISNAVVTGDIKTILFHGPSGTGKTMSCKLLAQMIDLPIMETINCTENLDEFVLGKYIPMDDKVIFQESYVTKAIRYGGAVVFEEINFAKPQYLAFLNSLLDDNGFVRLDSGEVVKRHKNFRFFATMNVGYLGTKELNQALYNRFNAVIAVNELSDKAIENMLITRVPECEEIVADVLKYYHQIQTKIEREELDIVISPRNLENWMRLARYESITEAAEDTIISVAKGDKELELDLRMLMRQYCWR